MKNETAEGGMVLGGRVAIVTGAGGGLGRSHALMLARLGAKVVVNDMNPGAAEAVAREIAAAGGEAIGFAASVTDEARIAEMVARAMTQWGRIDILVNNAGILRDKSFAKMTIAEFREVIDVHLMGSVICTKAVWEIMREQRHGRVVMTTSSSGLFGNFGQTNYAAAKMALVGLMQALALEGEKYGITVNCLAPTAATSMTGELLSDGLGRAAVSRVRQPRASGAGGRRRADAGDPVRRRRSFRSLEHHAYDGRLCGRRRGCSRARGGELGPDQRSDRRDRARPRLRADEARTGQRAGRGASASRQRLALEGRRHSEEAAVSRTKPSVEAGGKARSR